MKKIIEACIDRILEFDTQEEAAEYLEALRNKKTAFRIPHCEPGSCKRQVPYQGSGAVQQKPDDFRVIQQRKDEVK